MRQAIVTKYHGPTNHRGSRVSARCDAGRTTVEWDHALNPDANHTRAVVALVRKLGWSGRLHLGALPLASGGYVAVVEDGDPVEVQRG